MSSQRDRLHFVGSILAAPVARRYFANSTARWDNVLRRVPDGETGVSGPLWIKFQQKCCYEHLAIELDPTQPPLPVRQADGTVHRHIQLVRPKRAVDRDLIEFDTGYDRAALAPYQTFRRLRENVKTIPPEIRLRVALLTPMATGLMYG